MERRLAAILAADVVGYSRLMEADEETTFTTLNAPSFPATHPRMTVFAELTDGRGSTPITLKVVKVRADTLNDDEVYSHTADVTFDMGLEYRF